MGYPYGLSFQAQAFESRNSLAKALQAALSAEYPVCPIAEMEMFAYDKDVSLLLLLPTSMEFARHIPSTAIQYRINVSSSSYKSPCDSHGFQ